MAAARPPKPAPMMRALFEEEGSSSFFVKKEPKKLLVLGVVGPAGLGASESRCLKEGVDASLRWHDGIKRFSLTDKNPGSG